MAVVRSKIGKMTWKNYKFDGNGTRVPTRDAIILYGDKNVKVEFTADDKATIQRLMETSPKKVKHLSKQLRLRGPDAKGVMDSLYPRTRAEKIIGRAKAPEPKKEEIKAEPKKEEKKGIPLPPDLNKLTVKMLKELLEERKLSTEGKKADLIKRLTEDG
tara:strand:- start:1667 stop:2143 length:477 start_codon:yes stop_codon:yes gene_type:complete